MGKRHYSKNTFVCHHRKKKIKKKKILISRTFITKASEKYLSRGKSFYEKLLGTSEEPF